MNQLLLARQRLPGTTSFIKSNPMFRRLNEKERASMRELVNAATGAHKSGELKEGDDFPLPEEIALRSGASLAECLEAVTALLQSGTIRQDAAGRLSVGSKF